MRCRFWSARFCGSKNGTIRHMFKGLITGLLGLTLGLFAASPTSTNYTLKSYDFGNGGGSGSSTNYKLNVSTGAQSTTTQTSTTYSVNSGELPTQNANVPPAASFTNPSSEYNRLKLVINTGNNPTDTKYLVAISTDAFASITNYVQTDNTIGSANGVAVYQTYAAWGGASGVWVVGLVPSTTYTVKVRALQGNFSGSAYSPTASVATVSPSLTFSVATSLTGIPPYAITFTSLPSGVVTSGDATANLGLTTNAMSGGTVYVKSSGGLTSASASFTITSASADLSVATSGYGALVSTLGQVSGGPLTSASPYNGASNNVGALTTSLTLILTTAAPITTGTSTVTFKAKVDSITPSAADYSDAITFVAAMLY